jgi:hypothetical protein
VSKSLQNPVMNNVTGFFYFLNFANKSTYLQTLRCKFQRN